MKVMKKRLFAIWQGYPEGLMAPDYQRIQTYPIAVPVSKHRFGKVKEHRCLWFDSRSLPDYDSIRFTQAASACPSNPNATPESDHVHLGLFPPPAID
jgi:hypothetical protein